MRTDSSSSLHSSLPDDIALNIASCLQVIDVCSLSCCSRFWKELCEADCVWEGLCRDRWPSIAWDEKIQNRSHEINPKIAADSKGWKELYIGKHYEMAGKAALIIDFVERALADELIEVRDYLKAIELLNSQQFGFKDVQTFLFKTKLNVILNLVGVHYCVLCLGATVESVTDALITSRISKRRVYVQWWKLGRWFYGYRLRDELHSRDVALGDLAASDDEVLGVLHRGAVHEVLRVRISVVKRITDEFFGVGRTYPNWYV